MIDEALLQILRCPETRQPVRAADAGELARLNTFIASGQLKNRAGQPVTEPLEAGLTRADGLFLYPVRQAIPVMLIDEALPLG